MPLPKPKKNESHDDFMDRCMADSVMVKEYDDEKQRYAVCQTQWDDSRSQEPIIERRILDIEDMELRLTEGEKPKIKGYAAKFGKWSLDLGGFIEKIRKGAFDDVLENDVRALKNHDPNLLLGRTTSGTLELKTNSVGLITEIDPPDTTTGRDTVEEIRRKDITGMSFSFVTAEDDWKYPEDGPVERTIIKVGELFDVGPVTYPAYPDTSVAVRSLDEHRKNTEGEKQKSEEDEKVKRERRRDIDRKYKHAGRIINRNKLQWAFFYWQQIRRISMTVIQIKELAVEKAESARAIRDKADEESRAMTAEENETFDGFLKEAERLEQDAARQEKLEAAEKRFNEPAERKVTPEIAGTGQRIEVVTPELFRFGKLRAFKGPKAEANAYKAGKWLLATVMDHAASRQWCRDHGIEIRVQTESINAAGGFVVPDVMERAIIDLREEYGMFRANARVVPMGSDHTYIPRRAGGITAAFIGETTAITASDKSWNQVELTAKKLAALTRMSSDLSEDAIINLADDLAQEMAWAFAKKEDECGLDGDGTITYGGMHGLCVMFIDGTHTKGQDQGSTPYTSWSHATFADEIVAVMALAPAYALANAKWYIHPSGKAGLFDALAMQAGGAHVQELVNGVRAPMFAGYPIVTSAAMPSAPVNAKVAFFFGDLALSTTFGDRRGITIKVSTDRYLEYDQIGIQATERFCIVNHDIGDNTNAGPLIASIGLT